MYLQNNYNFFTGTYIGVSFLNSTQSNKAHTFQNTVMPIRHKLACTENATNQVTYNSTLDLLLNQHRVIYVVWWLWLADLFP